MIKFRTLVASGAKNIDIAHYNCIDSYIPYFCGAINGFDPQPPTAIMKAVSVAYTQFMDTTAPDDGGKAISGKVKQMKSDQGWTTAIKYHVSQFTGISKSEMSVFGGLCMASACVRCLIVVVDGANANYKTIFNTMWPDSDALLRHRVLALLKAPGGKFQPMIPPMGKSIDEMIYRKTMQLNEYGFVK